MTVSASCVYPLLFGWHWSHDCASQNHAHGFQGETCWHEAGNSCCQSATPPRPSKTLTGLVVSLAAVPIAGTRTGKTELMTVCGAGGRGGLRASLAPLLRA